MSKNKMLKRRGPLIDPCGLPDSTLLQWLLTPINFKSLDSVIKTAMNKFERLDIKTLSMWLGN